VRWYAEYKDAKLRGEVVFFHVSQESSGAQMAATDKHTPFKLNAESLAIGFPIVVHAKLSVRCKLIFLCKLAPAKGTPEDFKLGGWFQFLPHHFFSLYCDSPHDSLSL